MSKIETGTMTKTTNAEGLAEKIENFLGEYSYQAYIDHTARMELSVEMQVWGTNDHINAVLDDFIKNHMNEVCENADKKFPTQNVGKYIHEHILEMRKD